MKTLEQLQKEAYSRMMMDTRVFVVGGGFSYIKMFHDAGLSGARNVDEADIICFTGGEDVNPAMYGEKPIPGVYFNERRDGIEAGIYADAIAKKKPMVGICRGAQFLNVMNGGKLWQDVNNHANGQNHSVVDMQTGEDIVGMTSTHHQQMIAGKTATIIAVAAMSTSKENGDRKIVRANPDLDDMEVLFYEDSGSLCFQPHPEFNQGSCRDYFFKCFDNFILPLV